MSISQHIEGKEETSDTDSDAMGGKPQETMPELVDKKKRKRRPPLVPWKKPKDMPRRPLSAYNIFFKEQREAMMAQVAATDKAATEATHQSDSDSNVAEINKSRTRKRSNKSVGIGFANLARTIAANWKDMSEEARAPYEASAASEKARYKEEMLVWRAKQKRDKEKALLLSPGRTSADGKSVTPYPQGVLDSSGETSMDESHTGTVTSAPHSYSIPLACSTQGSRHGNPMGGSMDVDSPKRTRLTYQQHCDIMGYGGKMDPDTTPMHLSDMQVHWSHDPRSYSYPTGMDHGNSLSLRTRQSHPLHASLSRLDALQTTSHTMGVNGHPFPSFLNHAGTMVHFNANASDTAVGMPHQFEPYPFSHPSTNNPDQILQDEKRLIMQEHHMLQHQQMMHQPEGQQYRNQHDEMAFRNDPYTRRNSWSGILGTSRHQSKMASERPMGADTVRMMHSSVSPVNPTSGHMGRASTNIPDSWFEPETSTSNYSQSSCTPRNEQNATPRGSKLYPDTWFEVGEGRVHASAQNRQDEDEPMRYSPEGDLTGKLPPPSLGSFGKDLLVPVVPPKPQVGGKGDGKMEGQFQPPTRSPEEGLAVGSTCSVTALSSRVVRVKGEEIATKLNYSPEAIIESSSLQALGMQFDEETMDFLARLRYESTQTNPATAGSTD